jgi:hypothetical protein
VPTATAADLRGQGHDVQVAYDGFTALQIAEAFGPEVTLQDPNCAPVGALNISAIESVRPA